MKRDAFSKKTISPTPQKTHNAIHGREVKADFPNSPKKSLVLDFHPVSLRNNQMLQHVNGMGHATNAISRLR